MFLLSHLQFLAGVSSRLLSFFQNSIDESKDKLLFFARESSELIEAELQLRSRARLAFLGVRLTAEQLSDGHV